MKSVKRIILFIQLFGQSNKKIIISATPNARDKGRSSFHIDGFANHGQFALMNNYNSEVITLSGRPFILFGRLFISSQFQNFALNCRTPQHHAEEWYSIYLSMVYSKSAVDLTYIIVFYDAIGVFTVKVCWINGT